MKGQISVLVTAVVLALAAPARSQEMPKPSPEMAKLDFFEGNWSCQGKTNQSPLGPAGALTSTARVQDNLGGFWQSGTIKGTMPNMPPFEGMFHVTYDTGAKQFLMLWVDNMGGWARSTSAGWQADKLVYEGESHMPGMQPMKSRDTFTRGAGTMKHMWEMQVDGKWLAIGEETCSKK
jgi:hypothetical protein